MRLGILITHPIQYYVPFFRELSKVNDLRVKIFYCYQQTSEGQAESGFNVKFDWDVDLLEGYDYQFLMNVSKKPNVSSFFGCDTPEISKIISKKKFDAFLVFGWYIKSYWQAIFTCWKNSIPLLVRGDSQLSSSLSIKQIIKYPIYRYFISRFSACLYVGERSKEYYKFYGAKDENLFFCPHSVDNDFFYKNSRLNIEEINKLKGLHNLPKDSFVVLFVGKFINKKRPMDFIKGIERAKLKNNNIYGLMIGDGSLRTDLEQYIYDKTLPIKLVGFKNQTELPKYYGIADILVLPSDYGETWGLVVNEAFACGSPAIVSNQVGCTPDLIIENNTGYSYDFKDIETLSNFILKISEDISLEKKMKNNSIKHIKKYSVYQSVNGLVEALEKIINSN